MFNSLTKYIVICEKYLRFMLPLCFIFIKFQTEGKKKYFISLFFLLFCWASLFKDLVSFLSFFFFYFFYFIVTTFEQQKLCDKENLSENSIDHFVAKCKFLSFPFCFFYVNMIYFLPLVDTHTQYALFMLQFYFPRRFFSLFFSMPRENDFPPNVVSFFPQLYSPRTQNQN